MKNVVITGGAGGIGSGITKYFIEKNCKVYIIDTDEKAAENLIKEINSDNLIYWNLSVTDIEKLKKHVSSLKDNFEVNSIITLAGRALEDEWKKFEEQKLLQTLLACSI